MKHIGFQQQGWLQFGPASFLYATTDVDRTVKFVYFTLGTFAESNVYPECHDFLVIEVTTLIISSSGHWLSTTLKGLSPCKLIRL